MYVQSLIEIISNPNFGCVIAGFNERIDNLKSQVSKSKEEIDVCSFCSFHLHRTHTQTQILQTV